MSDKKKNSLYVQKTIILFDNSWKMKPRKKETERKSH